jgi:hypothetical protein
MKWFYLVRAAPEMLDDQQANAESLACHLSALDVTLRWGRRERRKEHKRKRITGKEGGEIGGKSDRRRWVGGGQI